MAKAIDRVNSQKISEGIIVCLFNSSSCSLKQHISALNFNSTNLLLTVRARKAILAFSKSTDTNSLACGNLTPKFLTDYASAAATLEH